ncbi:MAG: DUF2934 domain-containing protein [Alphaproteobacteria bacterium]|nr:DUF2934 domain-containing protein [Alphaproteobacteria bacterium]
MDTNRHKRIEQRAYAVWEAEGYPHGRHDEHWHFAARQIEAEEHGHASDKLKKRSSGRKKSKK